MANSIYESTFTGAIDGIIIIDVRGNIIEINPAALDLFGYKKVNPARRLGLQG